jgi:hypothetical protein
MQLSLDHLIIRSATPDRAVEKRAGAMSRIPSVARVAVGGLDRTWASSASVSSSRSRHWRGSSACARARREHGPAT